MTTGRQTHQTRQTPLADRAGRPEWTDEAPPADRVDRTEQMDRVDRTDRTDGHGHGPSAPTAGRSLRKETGGAGTHGDHSPGSPGGPGFLTPEERERFGRRLHDAVTGFVDDPRRSVTEADAVFEEVSHRITELLAERHRGLREPWQGEDAAERTEDLRKALRRYRDAADQLLRL